MKLHSQHLLTGNELSTQELSALLDLAISLKENKLIFTNLLKNKHLALLFDKPSLRTRFSFTIAMRELGGHVVESVNQSRKSEEPGDQIRVIQGYCDAIMIRTHEDIAFDQMKLFAKIPIINGLSDLYHPCQTLADLMTLQEKFNCLKGLSIAYIGDGNNVLHSLLLMAPKLGVTIHYCCPKGAEPNEKVLQMAGSNNANGNIKAYVTPGEAVKGCDAIYTDVWTSMGFNKKSEDLFNGYQVNEELLKLANPNAIVMHCMPMERGKEISATLPDKPCSVIFQQSENRLHVQKALLIGLIK